MEFLLTLTGIMTLCFLRPSYRDIKAGKYRVSQTVGAVAMLIGVLALSWVGSLAWENKLPEFLSKGPIGAVVGMTGVMLFAALFVVPAFLGLFLSQILAGAYWAMKTRHAG
jgi:hypothetical protein